MIIDECLLVFVHSQAEPAPPRLTTRSKAAASRRDMAAGKTGIPEPQADAPRVAMHSMEELSLIGCVDAMPVMQANRRIRAPTSMAARPRLGRPRPPLEAKLILPRRREDIARSRPEIDEKPVKKPRASRARANLEDGARKTSRRKPMALDMETRSRGQPTTVTYHSLISNLMTPDIEMKERALEISTSDIKSEPVLPINTAIRIVLQATLDLGRPYDTNMLAATFGVTRSLVMQSLRKYYEDFIEQSLFTEANFVPTYLWLYGLGGDSESVQRVVKAIELSGAAEPGSRSVFAIARDFVILYVSEVVYGVEAKAELAGLSSVAAVMGSIKASAEVPVCFLEMTNSFLYRARMTGRNVMRAKTELIRERGGTISGLFVDD